MVKNNLRASEQIRLRTEERLRSLQSDWKTLPADVQALIKELQNRQVELEIQNERLQAGLRKSAVRCERLSGELEQRVEQRTAELMAANRELEAFSYSVSHDLRAPLRSIDGFSGILLEKYFGLLDERGKDYLTRVRNAAQKMGRLIDEMLKLSRISRAPIHPEPVDMSELACSVMDELRQEHPLRDVAVDIAAGMHARGDAKLLRIVLENLLGNAWKFTGKCDRPRIAVGATELNGETVFYVKDNGAGFDMAHADSLFQPFHRLHTQEEFAGIGIGLTTVRRIVARHGGAVRAEAEKDGGATFYFTLGGGR